MFSSSPAFFKNEFYFVVLKQKKTFFFKKHIRFKTFEHLYELQLNNITNFYKMNQIIKSGLNVSYILHNRLKNKDFFYKKC